MSDTDRGGHLQKVPESMTDWYVDNIPLEDLETSLIQLSTLGRSIHSVHVLGSTRVLLISFRDLREEKKAAAEAVIEWTGPE